MRILSMWGVVISLFLTVGAAHAQKEVRRVEHLKLTDSLAVGSREFSSLEIYDQRLYLLAENRDDHLIGPSRGIYSLSLDDLEDCLSGRSPEISAYQYHPISGIDKLMEKIVDYEGLEALVLEKDRFFITVETGSAADSCYLFFGQWTDKAFRVDTTNVIALKKPLLSTGEKVFNAGFESLVLLNGHLYAFFEYNGFGENFAYKVSVESGQVEKLSLRGKIPFRLTDTARWQKGEVIGVNYFFPLKAEAIYQQGLGDKENALIRKSGKLHPFARLAVLKITKRKIKLKRFIAIPERWWTSNWEGLVRYRDGLLMVNDKYIEEGKHQTRLLFLDFKR